MPSSRIVVEETCHRLEYSSGTLPPEEVRREFNSLLRRLFEETLTVLEEYERRVDAGEILPELVRRF
jgi:hypothetical protein